MIYRCGGELLHKPDDGPTAFACAKCGAKMQSRWWAQMLARGTVPTAPACEEDENERASKLDESERSELTASTTSLAAAAAQPSSGAKRDSPSPSPAKSTSPRKSPDSNAKPPGRVPAGYTWDLERGVWIDADGNERPRGFNRLHRSGSGK